MSARLTASPNFRRESNFARLLDMPGTCDLREGLALVIEAVYLNLACKCICCM
jgi:hypothetical protein